MQNRAGLHHGQEDCPDLSNGEVVQTAEGAADRLNQAI